MVKGQSKSFELIQYNLVVTGFLPFLYISHKAHGHNGKLEELLGSMAREYSKGTAMSFLRFERPIGASYAVLFYSYSFSL
jgi:hypothetical protein